MMWIQHTALCGTLSTVYATVHHHGFDVSGTGQPNLGIKEPQWHGLEAGCLVRNMSSLPNIL